MSGALTAFYDLHYGPVSFDFVVWLVRALKERDARGCSALHVVVVPKEGGLGGFARNWGEHDAAATRWRLWHIVVGACPLAEATLTLAIDGAQARRLAIEPFWWPDGAAHHAGPLIEARRRGERIPRLRATEAARRFVKSSLRNLKRPMVTLTLRHQATVAERNSDAPDAARMARWLDERGYDALVVGDTNDALNDGRAYAELDVDLRQALYELAHMNIFGNNGPSVLPWFSGAPFLRFNCALPAQTHREHWKRYLALEDGDQLPWATAHQRLVYRPDTFEVMREEFTAWAGAMS